MNDTVPPEGAATPLESRLDHTTDDNTSSLTRMVVVPVVTVGWAS